MVLIKLSTSVCNWNQNVNYKFPIIFITWTIRLLKSFWPPTVSLYLLCDVQLLFTQFSWVLTLQTKNIYNQTHYNTHKGALVSDFHCWTLLLCRILFYFFINQLLRLIGTLLLWFIFISSSVSVCCCGRTLVICNYRFFTKLLKYGAFCNLPQESFVRVNKEISYYCKNHQ